MHRFHGTSALEANLLLSALCIVGVGGSRLLSTHPPTAVRVRRLEALEARLAIRTPW